MRCTACNTVINSGDDDLCLTCLGSIKYYDDEPEAETCCTRWGGYSVMEELGLNMENINNAE
jgi:hypothetical protein